ncbi:hypothetical protein PSENEW3n2_00002190 [Picochlorum sp. SENEW3]|nr:hypothetical protein PSENEW3n2_00002190 [Picochlorum sp. SENEW3]WPT15826.1 hypothetical protein PSENEW3_00002190 [Picochlorum sp. SENEW3]
MADHGELERFWHICEKKSEDGGIELIQKISAACEDGEIDGGFQKTIIEYSLLEDERLPLVHYTLVTPKEMKRNIINQRVTAIVKRHFDGIEHVVCPDRVGKQSTTIHSFFIVSPKCLNMLLQQFFSEDEKIIQDVSVVYEASKQVGATTQEITPRARVCVRVQVCAYIQCRASDEDLADNENWKLLKRDLHKSFSRAVGDKTLRDAQISLMAAAKVIPISNKRRETATNPRGDAGPSSRNEKRQTASGLDGDTLQHAVRSVRPRREAAGGDVTEQGDTSDGSPNSVLPQPWQENQTIDLMGMVSSLGHGVEPSHPRPDQDFWDFVKRSSKRQRPLDLVDGKKEPRHASCLVRSIGGGDGDGDTSAAGQGNNHVHGSPDSVLPNNKRQKLVEPTAGGTRDPDCSSSDATVSEQFPGHPQEVMSPISEIEAANILSEIRTKHL